MYCRNCGKEVDESDKFCNGCGSNTMRIERTEKSSNSLFKKINVFSIICTIAIIVLLQNFAIAQIHSRLRRR